jgi:hypothetical protein
MLEFAQAISNTPDAAALGYRTIQGSMAEHSMSYLPHAPSNPTHQQFAPSTPPPPPPGASTPAPALQAVKLTGQDTAAARAETLIGAEASTRPPATKSNGGAIAVAAIAFLALGGGGVWFMAKHNASTTSPAPETSIAVATKPPDPPANVAPAAAPSAEPVKAAESTATVTPTSAVRLEVSSEPAGATLLKNGFQVCDVTPCEVLATPNETLELQAVKGALKGTAKVLAQRDQTVTIKLGAPSVAATPKHDSQHMCEVEVDGLKILRACK